MVASINSYSSQLQGGQIETITPYRRILQESQRMQLWLIIVIIIAVLVICAALHVVCKYKQQVKHNRQRGYEITLNDSHRPVESKQILESVVRSPRVNTNDQNDLEHGGTNGVARGQMGIITMASKDDTTMNYGAK